MATKKKKKLSPKTKADYPVKSVLSSKKSDNLVIDLEVLMVPLAILVAGLMVSISILVAFKDTSLNKAATTDGTGLAANPTPAPTDAGYDYAVMDGLAAGSIDDDPSMGNKDAKVVIIEFSDYECPFCKRHAQEVAPLIQENYVDTGDVLWVFRDFPIDSLHGELAFKQAEAAECVRDIAGDKKYFEYHDLIFSTTQSNIGMDASQLYELATDVGVDANSFASCYDSGKFTDEVLADFAAGESYGVRSTPSFIVGQLDDNGEVDGVTIVGAQAYADFAAALDYQLAQ